MTCKELIEFLSDYLAGEVEPPQREAFERHLAVCPPCAAYLETFKRTIQLSRSSFEEDEGAARQMPEELVQAILRARATSAGSG
jgi:anti-sigma factor RsiW